MSPAPTHDTRLTPDGLTVCCDEDPRTLDGGFALEPGKATCKPAKTATESGTDG